MPATTAPSADERLQRTPWIRKVMARPELGAVAGTVLVFIFFAFVAGGSGMFTALGVINFLEVSAQLGIIAVAACMLMIGGEFDLSIGSMIGAAGVIIAIPAVHYGWPLWLSGIGAIGIGAVLGLAVHQLIITPILASPPINQLLATGGLLFFVQSFATLLWSTDHKSVRVTLPTIEVAGIFVSFTRLIAFVLAIVAMIALYLFLTRTFTGTAIRAVSQDREAIALMGARPQRLYLVTSAVGGAMAGIAGALLIIQYAVHPYFGAAFGPITFMICVLGGLGNMVGAFVASFVMSEVIAISGVIWSTEMGYVFAFVVFIVMIFVRPGGILSRRG